jgi:type I site-specific restriction endonuclease
MTVKLTLAENMYCLNLKMKIENKIEKFPTPMELWNRLNSVEPIKPEIQETFLKPFVATPGKKIRCYQQIAINKAVKAILDCKHRVLLTLATGTGKTTVAFQVIHKLWSNRWNKKSEYLIPKVLFLADRSDLVTDPHAKDFALFGDERCLVPDKGLPSSREIYFLTYQSLAEDNNKVGAFRNLPRTKSVAKHLYQFMLKNGRFDKSIVFCVNQEHADQLRREISNLNADLVRQYPDYALRIVSEEGDIGKGHLGIASASDNGRFASHRFLSRVANEEAINKKLLWFHLIFGDGRKDMQIACRGGAGRNRPINMSILEKVKIPIPDFDEQQEFVSLLDKLNEVKINHTQTEKN